MNEWMNELSTWQFNEFFQSLNAIIQAKTNRKYIHFCYIIVDFDLKIWKKNIK